MMRAFHYATLVMSLGFLSPTLSFSAPTEAWIEPADAFIETGSYEDTDEFLFSDDPSVPDLGKPTFESTADATPSPVPGTQASQNELDDLLSTQGEWSYQFIYYPQKGQPQVLKSVRSNELVKPASLLKIFTGWMAFEKKALPTPKLSYMLQTSNNPIADATFNKMGAQKSFKKFFQNELEVTLDSKTAQIYNGSGNPVYLTRGNRKVKFNSWMKSSLVPELLEHILKSEEYAEFKMTLAMPGQRGTLHSRFQDFTGYPLYAKTGTLNAVANLAGFVELPKGTLVFNVISDELKSVSDGRQQIDALVKRYVLAAEEAQKFLDVFQNPFLNFFNY